MMLGRSPRAVVATIANKQKIEKESTSRFKIRDHSNLFTRSVNTGLEPPDVTEHPSLTR